MYALALADGDLVVGPTGHAVVGGAPKIRQDLAYALGETYGNDRFHPTWGSTIPAMIGEAIGPESAFEVRSEVARTITQYIAIQGNEIVNDAVSGARSRYQTADVISSVEEISASVDFDAIRIAVRLTTLAGDAVQVQRTVSP